MHQPNLWLPILKDLLEVLIFGGFLAAVAWSVEKRFPTA
jgi:hypothetical protein